MMLELRNIYKTYLQGKMEVPVLKDVSLSVEDGEYLAIMGPSGSGKTTLMNIIGCLDTPSSGEYLLEEEELSHQSDARLSEVRLRSIGFVFQSFYLLSRQSALENVALPLLYAGVKRKERLETARKALERVGLADRADFKPTQLSGGQCQRVAIARAIVNNPKLLLADEPTGALDTASGEQVMEIFQKLNADGVTIVMITHEPEIAAHAQRTLHIRDGRLIDSEGAPSEKKTDIPTEKPETEIAETEPVFSIDEPDPAVEEGPAVSIENSDISEEEPELSIEELPALEEEPELSIEELSALEEEPELPVEELPPLEKEPEPSTEELPPIEKEPEPSVEELPALEKEPEFSVEELPPIEKEPELPVEELPPLEKEPEPFPFMEEALVVAPVDDENEPEQLSFNIWEDPAPVQPEETPAKEDMEPEPEQPDENQTGWTDVPSDSAEEPLPGQFGAPLKLDVDLSRIFETEEPPLEAGGFQSPIPVDLDSLQLRPEDPSGEKGGQ